MHEFLIVDVVVDEWVVESECVFVVEADFLLF